MENGEKKIITLESREQKLINTLNPEYELDQYGPDLAEHNGISQINLTCPHCKSTSTFHTLFTVVSKHPLDKATGQPRTFHTLSRCALCNNVIYVQAEDYDFDPDYFFQYNNHFPRETSPALFQCAPNKIVQLYRDAEKSLYAYAYLGTVLICKKIINEI